jgi:hypothetical protein
MVLIGYGKMVVLGALSPPRSAMVRVLVRIIRQIGVSDGTLDLIFFGEPRRPPSGSGVKLGSRLLTARARPSAWVKTIRWTEGQVLQRLENFERVDGATRSTSFLLARG